MPWLNMFGKRGPTKAAIEREQKRAAELEEQKRRNKEFWNEYDSTVEPRDLISEMREKEKLEQLREKLHRIFRPLLDASTKDPETGLLTDKAMIEFKALMKLMGEAEEMYAANIPIDFEELRRKADAVAPAAAGTLRAKYEDAIQGGRRRKTTRRRKAARRKSTRRRR
jgi:hypothetical protein